MAAFVNVRIDPANKSLLDDLKVHPRETYADVIDRIALQTIDDEPLTNNEADEIAEAVEDIRAGRTFSTASSGASSESDGPGLHCRLDPESGVLARAPLARGAGADRGPR
jgi:hypothetical protein